MMSMVLFLINSDGEFFIKSNDRIKGYSTFVGVANGLYFPFDIPDGNYQISEKINIDSEWRAFVYDGKLVGLQNYSGDFTRFPDIRTIKGMIEMYKSSPIAYTLDIGINDDSGTFVIECHDFFSVGLYGFADYKRLPHMFYQWFQEYIKK
jgi:ATP-grasp domain, R2K clade family 2